jgi:uncharacterized protein YndB with AHSA1/START domain
MTTPNTSRLIVTTPSDREIQLVREFDAPRDLLFDAFSSCQHVQAWWGQAGSTMPVCELDFRVGGKWRFVEREANGSEWAFHGEFREIARPRRLVQTFEFEGMPGHVSLETSVFEDLGSRTRLVTTSVFDSKEDRDGMIASGMEKGAGETYDRLDAYLTSLR